MPLLYGEGEKAFIRLQEETLKQNEDESLFVHKGYEFGDGSPLAKSADVSLYKHDYRFHGEGRMPSATPFLITNKGIQVISLSSHVLTGRSTSPNAMVCWLYSIAVEVIFLSGLPYF
jgi:hypothetical protein